VNLSLGWNVVLAWALVCVALAVVILVLTAFA
jgi:hypothetical protein